MAELDYQWDEGVKKGIEKGKIQVALNMIHMGLSLDEVSKCTGFSSETLNKLKKSECIKESKNKKAL